MRNCAFGVPKRIVAGRLRVQLAVNDRSNVQSAPSVYDFRRYRYDPGHLLRTMADSAVATLFSKARVRRVRAGPLTVRMRLRSQEQRPNRIGSVQPRGLPAGAYRAKRRTSAAEST